MDQAASLFSNVMRASSIGLIALAGAPALASGVDAGTLIENTAQATFDTPQGNQVAQSNTVTLRVDEVLDVVVASLDPGPINTGVDNVVLSFSVTNTGNGAESFALSAEPSVAGNDFDLIVGDIAVDTNSNGVYDEGVDLLLSSPAVTPEIAADSSATVFLLATISSGTLDAARSTVQLEARALTGSGTPGDVITGAGQGGSDAVVGATGAMGFAVGEVIFSSQSVTLSKSAIVSDPFGGSAPIPGAIIAYSIIAEVGGGSVENLIIADPIPVGTTYVPGTLQLNSAPLTDSSGDDAGEFNVSGVSVALGTVAAGTSNTIQFNVRIEE